MTTDREIKRRLAKLDALEAAGVDNWDHYDEALGLWYKENHVDECLDKCIDSIHDVLAEKDLIKEIDQHRLSGSVLFAEYMFKDSVFRLEGLSPVRGIGGGEAAGNSYVQFCTEEHAQAYRKKDWPKGLRRVKASTVMKWMESDQ